MKIFKWAFVCVLGLFFLSLLLNPSPEVESEQQATPAEQVEAEQPRVEVASEPVTGWVPHAYEIVTDEDISSSIRSRRRIRIVSPTAHTPEDRLATLMQAVRQAWGTHHAEFTVGFLVPYEDEGSSALARIDFAPDGCGITGEGDDCTGEVWTDAHASDVVMSPDQIRFETAWFEHEDNFQDDSEYGPILNEDRLVAFLADRFNTTAEHILSQVSFYYAEKDMDIPQGVKDRFPPLSEQEIEAAEEVACRNNLQCWGDTHHLRATFACQPLVEDAALYTYEWTDGFLGSKFERFQWADRGAGTLRYGGDSVRFQNAFGAWQNMTYWCEYDPATETAELIVLN